MENNTAFTKHYSVGGWVSGKRLSVTSDAMVAEFDRLALPVPAYLANLLKNGMKYSNEDFDTLCAAMRELYKIDANVWQRLGTA